ncbi:MAG TPA: hypothetical protein VMH30_14550, partial [Verrucomicrobiae bacterium]|nr:hypothetical protein [Verrucomicrobiae bacterium]
VATPSGETPAQAAARAALMEKLSEMNNAESSNTGSSAPSVIVNTNEFGNVSAPAPAVMGASSTANGVTSPSSGMMTNQNMNMPMTPPPAEVTGAPVFLPVPPPSTGYDEAAGAALHQSQTNIAVTGAPVPSSSSPSVPNFSVSEQAQSNVDEITARELGLQPIQPPPPPVSAAQQEQLQELLQRYDANQITPEEYQAERAKIMAGQ